MFLTWCCPTERRPATNATSSEFPPIVSIIELVHHSASRGPSQPRCGEVLSLPSV